MRSTYQMNFYLILTLQKSELPAAVALWSSPWGLTRWKAKFTITLMRKHRVLETFSLVLYSWIPQEIKKTWSSLQIPAVIYKVRLRI